MGARECGSINLSPGPVDHPCNNTYGLVPLSREIDSWQVLTMPGIERTDRKSSRAIGADPVGLGYTIVAVTCSLL
jgi:hypothetical protein